VNTAPRSTRYTDKIQPRLVSSHVQWIAPSAQGLTRSPRSQAVINSPVISLGARNTYHSRLTYTCLCRSSAVIHSWDSHVKLTLQDSMYLPLPAAFEAPKRGMSAFGPAPGKGLPSLRCTATALGHHVAVRPVTRAACHSSEAHN
jgi:hypothetical protein